MVEGLEIVVAMGCFFSLWYGLLVVVALRVRKGCRRSAALSDASNFKKAAAQITDKRYHKAGNKVHVWSVDYWFSVVDEGKMTVEVKVVGREVPHTLYEEIQAGDVEMVRYLANKPQSCRLEKAHEADVGDAGRNDRLVTYAAFAIFCAAPPLVCAQAMPSFVAGVLTIAIVAVGAFMISACGWLAVPAMCGGEKFRDVTVTEMGRGVTPREPAPVVKEGV